MSDKLVEAIFRNLKGQDADRLRDGLRQRDELKQIKAQRGPVTKEELWQTIKDKVGVELSTVAVCPGHHSQLDMVWEVYNFEVYNVLWVMSRGGGKCLPADALVYDAETGREVPIGDLCDGRGLRVASMNTAGEIVAADAHGEPNIVKPCVTLQMLGGRRITLSDDHPVLTARGWTEAGQVSEGERLAMPHVLPEPDWIVPYGEAELDLLALLLAEGGYTGQSVVFTSADESLLDVARAAVETYGCRLVYSQQYDYRIAYHRGARNPVREMLDKAGLGNTLAKHKRVPKLLFQASDQQIERFLQIFWMCDGYVNVSGPEIVLASEGLIHDLRLLLLRLGIQSSVREKPVTYKDNVYRSWRLAILSGSFRSFHKRLKLWGAKGQRMVDLVARKSNPNRGRPILPEGLIDDLQEAALGLPKDARRDRGYSLSERFGTPRRPLGTDVVLQRGRMTTSAARLAAFVEQLPEQDWSDQQFLWSEQIWWDDVKSVEDAGMQQTYDLCVPEHGNFVADGLIVHNTSLASWMDEIQCEYWPGFSVFTIGANSTQGTRKYEYMLPLVVEGGTIGGKELDHVIRSTSTVTQFKNGSKAEIALAGTPNEANGPRVPRLHRDEVELMRRDTFKQAANIPAGRKMRDGRYAPAQWLDTSTMKSAEGHVDLAIQAYNKAIEKGVRPSQDVRVCCIFEVSAENPACRSVPQAERRARLRELGLPEDQVCDCDTYIKDFWPAEDEADDDDLEERTLESVCQGRFFKSRGHKDFTDVRGLFLANDREEWNAEQECAQPSTEGAYIRSYNQTRNGVKGFGPDPQNGLIYSSTDWGSGDEAWHGWFQVLDRPAQVRSFKGDGVRTLPAGSLVVFGEIYKAGMGNIELGQMVLEREAQWIIDYPGWRVHERYYDNAGLSAALDWRDQLGMAMTNRIRKDFIEELKYVRTRVGRKSGLFVDILNCPWFDKSIRAWRQESGREVHDWSCLPGETKIAMADREYKRIDEVVAGELVWTRGGLRPVIWSGMTKVDDTVVVEHERGWLECTGDHRIWTQRGWVQAQHLTNNDMILQCASFEKSESASMSNIGGNAGTATPNLNASPTESISVLDDDTSTDRSGKTTGARSQRATRSTISTVTPTTTSSTTFERSPSTNIAASTALVLGLRSKRSTSTVFGPQPMLPLARWPRRIKVGSLRGSVAKRPGQIDPTLSVPVNGVVRTTRLERLGRLASVLKTVVRRSDARAGSTMKNDPVLNVEPPLWSTATPELSTAPGRVLRVRSGRHAVPVYDLHVEEHHEFIAEGVLVHNSHAMAAFRYLEHNLHVIERKLAKSGHISATPGAADDQPNRVREREEELVSRRSNPLRTGGEAIPVIGVSPEETREDIGGIGAEDSPLRETSRSMGGESDWRHGFDRIVH